MKVQIWLKNTSDPIRYENVLNAYEKGSFYCIYISGKVIKYPVVDVFRVVEDYPDELRLSV